MQFLTWFIGRNREVKDGNTLSPPNDLKVLAEEMKSHAENVFVAGRKPTAEDMRSYNDSTGTKSLQAAAETKHQDSSSRVFEKAGMTFVSGSNWLHLPSRFENRIFITVGEPEKLGSLVWVVVRPIRKSAPLIDLSFDAQEFEDWNHWFIPDRKTAYACRSNGQLYECWVPDSLSDKFPQCFDSAP